MIVKVSEMEEVMCEWETVCVEVAVERNRRISKSGGSSSSSSCGSSELRERSNKSLIPKLSPPGRRGKKSVLI